MPNQNILTNIHTCICVNIHTYMRVNIHTCICVNIPTYIRV